MIISLTNVQYLLQPIKIITLFPISIMSIIKNEIIELDKIDSTNNYAMKLIDDDMAAHGTTITTQSQSHGKGQRGRQWVDELGKSLLMSIVIVPKHDLNAQFLFSASITTAIANVLQNYINDTSVTIKWPNDIIIHDKKAGGILIENVIRGSKWTYSVIGLGMNVLQDTFPESLPFATSLKIASGKEYVISTLRDDIRAAVINVASFPLSDNMVMERYNHLLYKKDNQQAFRINDDVISATISHVNKQGELEVVLDDGTRRAYKHGSVVWEYC